MDAYTQPVDWLERPCLGYVVNAGFSEENTAVLSELMARIGRRFGDNIHLALPHSLHITLLDWIAPLVEYGGQDKAALFERIKDEYDVALTEALADISPFVVAFGEIHVSPTTIYMTGQDDGQFETIRQTFSCSVVLPEGAKPFPTIVHSSLGRFTGRVSMAEAREFLAQQVVTFGQEISDFRLLRARAALITDFDVVRTYRLEGV